MLEPRWAIVLLAAAMLPGCGSEQGVPPEFTEPQVDTLNPIKVTAAAAVRDGAQVYRQTCAYCHEHNVGPKILGRNYPADAMAMIVRSGLNGMPSFRATDITDAELKAVTEYVATSAASTGAGS